LLPDRQEVAKGQTLIAPLSVELKAALQQQGKADLNVTMQLGAVEDRLLRGGPPIDDAASSPSIPLSVLESLPIVPARRRHSRNRPLVVVTLVGICALCALGVLALRSPLDGPWADSSSWESTDPVALAEFDGVLGLTDENKEVVLALCFQLSRHPNSECRLSHLRELAEFPARPVTLPAFAIDRYEVSNRDWEACEASGGCDARELAACTHYSVARGRELRTPVPDSMQGPNLPALCATFAEAQRYCRWRGGRLPTQDEWERAARSGDDRLQPWGPFALPGLLNWGERIQRDFPIPGRVDGFELTAPVDSYRSGATDDGLFNLLGNVSEWVEPGPDELAGTAGVRGGSYVTEFQDLRATFHRSLDQMERRSTVGLRCVYPVD
jgi:hypothetical protein